VSIGSVGGAIRARFAGTVGLANVTAAERAYALVGARLACSQPALTAAPERSHA
jgi:hypothetical protein